ncbi:outer membrane beta-barrel protein [Pedobacter sp.]|uniref:outer membrane beta-barrel protein n=1 Tax=Pedobacter sp. TaxID=1411316 RepID=UPI003D7F5BC1
MCKPEPILAKPVAITGPLSCLMFTLFLCSMLFVSVFAQEKPEKSLSAKPDSCTVIPKDGTPLKEVQISGSKQTFYNNKGNIKVNIENTLFSQIPSVVELLSKLPTVQLSNDKENINIIGRGEPLIYLDNQRIIVNDLNNLSTSDIKTIDIIHNPSSKYEAEGRSVIVITRNKRKEDGSKVSLSTTNSFKRYFHTRNGLQVNVKKNKLEFKGGLQYNHQNLWESNGNDFSIPEQNIASNYRVYSIGTRKQTILNGGIYYHINETDYLSADVNKRYQDGDFVNTTNSTIMQLGVLDHIYTLNNNEGARPLFNANLNFNKNFKNLGGQLFLGAQYARFAHDVSNTVYNNNNYTEAILNHKRLQHYGAEVVTGRADFEKTFQPKMKLDIGTSVSVATSMSGLNQTEYDPTNETESIFEYGERLYAAYAQLSGELNKLTYTAGLRMEHADNEGTGSSSSLLLKKNTTDFFPKASLSLPMGDANSLSLSYAKTITRPNYAALSQLTIYINPFFEWANNTNINPSIKQELAATVQLNNNSLSLSYYTANDPVYYAIQFDNNDQKLRMINTNYESESGLNLLVTVPFKYKIWKSTNTFTGAASKVKDPAARSNKMKPYLYVYSNNQLQLPAGYTLMVSGWAISKRNDGVFDQNAMYAIDTAISKTFAKKLTATVSYNSILSTTESKENFATHNVVARGVYYADVREIGLSLKYAFGDIKESRFKNKEVNDSRGRIN